MRHEVESNCPLLDQKDKKTEQNCAYCRRQDDKGLKIVFQPLLCVRTSQRDTTPTEINAHSPRINVGRVTSKKAGTARKAVAAPILTRKK